MSIKLNEKAPTFALYNTQKEEVKLEDFSGHNVVLLFFPLAFTSVCTEELCHARDNMSRYESLNAKVLGISVDSLFALEKFKEEQSLNFPLLSDFNKEVSRSYDALYEDFVLGMRGVSKRSAFVIDGEGIVRHAEILEDAGQMPDFNALMTAIESINA